MQVQGASLPPGYGLLFRSKGQVPIQLGLSRTDKWVMYRGI